MAENTWAKKHPIVPEWEEYYQALEGIRRSGITNMWGATPYLAEYCDIDKELAGKVLSSWISNYDELNEKYGWQ